MSNDRLPNANEPRVADGAAARLLARFTEQTAIRRLARGLTGELLLGGSRRRHRRSDARSAHLHDRTGGRLARSLRVHDAPHERGCVPSGLPRRGSGASLASETRAALVCLVDDTVSAEGREVLGRVFDRVPVVERLRAHESSYPRELLSDAYRDTYTKLHLFDTELFPHERVCFIDADLLPIRCFDHLFTLPAPAAVIESVDPTSQFAYVQHMHGVRHGDRVPPAILEPTSDDDVTGGINSGLLVIAPDRARFTDMVARIRRPMPEWGEHHRRLYEHGIRYGFPDQHFLQVEFQDSWTAIDPRFNSMRTDIPHSFGIHWTIGRKPWENLRNPTRSASLALWAVAWETLRLHHPDVCARAEERGLVRDRPA
jgi:hypothetical protein